ncbi:MAG: phosphodiester glycosidase family protein [Pararhizobium sp.]|nr:phosphodiester glycosidase family protein [Pararhizobium sp.]MDO9418715.1 phosphodiester glycosidase family protein [Pararhizobium sp.]
MNLKFLAALVLSLVAGLVSAQAECRHVPHKDDIYTVCSFDPAKADIRTFNTDKAGAPYGSFRALGKDLRTRSAFLAFAVNGGMYHSDLLPVGLFVEEGQERKAISTKSGWGNFHLQPNGVFFVDTGKAGVLDTPTYIRSGFKPQFATQSGPMLVIGGKIHPKFLADSDSFKIRNGVGFSPDGMVHFAVSEGPVRFYDFAEFYRDVLGCPNALFLDGSISSLYAPVIGRNDRLFPLGPIIAVVGTIAK